MVIIFCVHVIFHWSLPIIPGPFWILLCLLPLIIFFVSFFFPPSPFSFAKTHKGSLSSLLSFNDHRDCYRSSCFARRCLEDDVVDGDVLFVIIEPSRLPLDLEFDGLCCFLVVVAKIVVDSSSSSLVDRCLRFYVFCYFAFIDFVGV